MTRLQKHISLMAFWSLATSLAFAEVDTCGNGEGEIRTAPPEIPVMQGFTLIMSCPSPVAGNVGLTWDGNFLWISDFFTRRAYQVDPVTCQSVFSIPLPGTYPTGLAWDGSHLWYAEGNGETIYELDPADGTVISSFSSPGGFPVGLTWVSGNVWNTDTDCNLGSCTPDEIHELTPAGGLLDTFAAPGGFPAGLAYDGQNLWHSDNVTDTIYKMDPADLTILDSFPSPGTFPNDLAWDGQYLWVMDNGTDMLYQYDVGESDSCVDEDGDGRVTICHIPPGNPDNAHTILVSMRALPAHLAHGDYCGQCEGDSGMLLRAGDGEARSTDLKPAMATRLTFVAQGTVDFVSPELSGTFSLGDIFTVVYTFESATPDSDPSPNRGNYVNAITALLTTVGTYNATYAGDNIITIFDNNFGADEYRIDLLDSMSGPSVGGFDLSIQGPILQLRDPTSTAFTTDALPTSPPNPADFISGGTFLALEFLDPLHPDNIPLVEADVSSIILVQDCADNGDGKVTICHIPPGNPGNAHTITVSVNAVPAHLAHGDYCGPCEGGLSADLEAGIILGVQREKDTRESVAPVLRERGP